ncbi:hypothetical protein LB553_28765 [Mesorhizobium sp. CA8]|uniref:hypothetical protein n=1 Tax=Mesorhizobium sp. CA8 TaxID=2876637 RepID=UPI001CCBE00D|nr:hypothetical protein [Mesorhizobium sp. CA8]MBZ9764828.1 hypothetical protein [Mesorhizobium sp. CA8]
MRFIRGSPSGMAGFAAGLFCPTLKLLGKSVVAGGDRIFCPTLKLLGKNLVAGGDPVIARRRAIANF